MINKNETTSNHSGEASKPLLKVAIIAIGRELLLGDVLDTNSKFIAETVKELGLSLKRISTVDDVEEEIVAELRNSIQQADIIITTGGLGPTSDDRTRQAIAKAVGTELKQDDQSLTRAVEYAKKRNRPINENNLRQTYFPELATIVANDWGTADAFITPANLASINKHFPAVESQNQLQPTCQIISLPGVPKEMRPLIEQRIGPWLRDNYNLPPTAANICLRCFGLSEAHIGSTIEAISLPAEIEIAYRPQFPEILLKITTTERNNQQLAADKLKLAEAEISSALGEEFIFSRKENQSLAQTVADLLIERSLTLAAAESCSGGLLADRLVSIPGASAFFLASLVTYSNQAKEVFAGVPAEIIEIHGAVSEQTALLLAAGARQRAIADYGLAITGIAGPDGGTEQKPVGTVWIGLASEAEELAVCYQLPWERAAVREYSVSLALDLLRRKLLNYSLLGSVTGSPIRITR